MYVIYFSQYTVISMQSSWLHIKGLLKELIQLLYPWVTILGLPTKRKEIIP